MFNLERIIGEITHYLFAPQILEGLWTTVWLSIVSLLLATVVGVVAVVLYETNWKILQAIYMAFVLLMRGTPLLVQLVFVYAGLPALGIRFDVITCALIALALHEGAYIAELIRGGIVGVGKGQWLAGRSLGMRDHRILQKIVLPQAIRSILPPYGNQVISLIKATSLVSVISVTELFRSSQMMISTDFRVLIWFGVAAMYYLLLCGLWTLVQTKIEQLAQLPGEAKTEPRKTGPRILQIGRI